MRFSSSLILILFLTLNSCGSSSEYYYNKLQSVDISKFYNFSVISRGSYLLITSKYADLKYSCTYFHYQNRYLFPNKVDSLIKSGKIDSLELTNSLKNSVDEYLLSDAIRVRGNSSIVKIYYTKKNLFIKFNSNYDSLEIDNFFDKEKYSKIDSFYFCKPKHHLRLY